MDSAWYWGQNRTEWGFQGKVAAARRHPLAPPPPATPSRTSWEPWEKLSRAMFMPALIISLRRSTERDAGPGTREPAQATFSPNPRDQPAPRRHPQRGRVPQTSCYRTFSP